MTIKTLIYRVKTSLYMLLFSVVFSTSINARQLDDIEVSDNVTLEGTTVPLQLNGMGYRTKFVFNIYVGALYTEKTADSRDAVQALKGPKRVLMHMVYDEVSQKKMADAWREGFEENNSDEQYEKLEARLNAFISYFPDLKEGDVVLLDYIPETGTIVSFNGEARDAIEGADFYAALLDVWLGEEPADDDLKDAMLGGQGD